MILFSVQFVQLNLYERKRQNSLENHAALKNTNILRVKALYLEPLSTRPTIPCFGTNSFARDSPNYSRRSKKAIRVRSDIILAIH